MPSNFRRVDAPDVLATFAGFSQMMDRLHEGPVAVTPPTIGPIHAGKSWSFDDEVKLINLYGKGFSMRKIGQEMGRTAKACEMRLYVLGYGRQ